MKAIDIRELKKMLDGPDRPALVNTLPEESFDETRIPGAVNIPQDRDDFVERVEQTVGGREEPVIVYCASQQCHSSSEAARKLEQAGFTSVFDFEAGAAGWQEAEQTA